MQFNFALPVMGAMLAATLGGITCRWCLALKFNYLVYLWLLVFIGALKILFMLINGIVPEGNFMTWMLSVLGCSVGSVFIYCRDRYHNSRVLAVKDERPWRIACGCFLLLCAIGMAMTCAWWIEEASRFLGWKAIMAFPLCTAVLTFSGVFTLVRGRDNQSAAPYRLVLEVAHPPFELRVIRPSPPECGNRNQRPESAKMGAGIESLFTAALGLAAPWEVAKVELNTRRRRIDLDLNCKASRLNCPQCGAADQSVHDGVRKHWRHPDFFQHQAWLYANVPCVSCSACGKTSEVQIPWALPRGSTWEVIVKLLTGQWMQWH